MQPTSNRHYRIHTRTLGVHEVAAQTARHAVAALVARLKLTEQQTQQVTRWIVFKDDECEQSGAEMKA